MYIKKKEDKAQVWADFTMCNIWSYTLTWCTFLYINHTFQTLYQDHIVLRLKFLVNIFFK